MKDLKTRLSPNSKAPKSNPKLDIPTKLDFGWLSIENSWSEL